MPLYTRNPQRPLPLVFSLLTKEGLLQVGFGMRDSLAASAMESVYTMMVILAQKFERCQGGVKFGH